MEIQMGMTIYGGDGDDDDVGPRPIYEHGNTDGDDHI
jgi:hypothetical protein